MNENDWEKIIGPVRVHRGKEEHDPQSWLERTWNGSWGKRSCFQLHFGLTLFFNLVDSFTLNSHLQ